MKRILLVSVVLFVFVAMVACATTPSGQKILRARGTVLSYEPGKMINLKPGAAEIEYTGGGDYVAAPENAPPAVFALCDHSGHRSERDNQTRYQSAHPVHTSRHGE